MLSRAKMPAQRLALTVRGSRGWRRGPRVPARCLGPAAGKFQHTQTGKLSTYAQHCEDEYRHEQRDCVDSFSVLKTECWNRNEMGGVLKSSCFEGKGCETIRLRSSISMASLSSPAS